METRIQIPHLLFKLISPLKFFIGNRLITPNFISCESVFFHNFTLFFLDNQVRFNRFKYMVEHIACCLPSIYRAIKSFFRCPSIARFFRSTISFFKPKYQRFIATSYFNTMMPLYFTSVFIWIASNIKTSLTINNTSKICMLLWCLIGMVLNSFCHNYPLVIDENTVVNDSIIINDNKVHAERLNERDSFRVCESLNSDRKTERKIRRGFPAYKLGHKSNRLVLNEAAQRLGVSLRQTEDELIRDMLASTAGYINCTAGTNGDTPTELTRADADEIVQTLLDNDAYTMMPNIDGEDKFGSAPVRDAYFAMCSTKLTGSQGLDGVEGFIHKNNYPAPNKALESEWGSIGNLRFLVSSIGSRTRNASLNGNDVFNIFCVGREAYACIEQDNYSSQFIYRPAMYDGPLALNSSVGYKMAQAVRILNDAWVLNLRCTRA